MCLALSLIGAVGGSLDDGAGAMAIGEVDCVFAEVQNVSSLSAVAVGTCHLSGDGHIAVTVAAARVFSGAGAVLRSRNLAVFEGLNAAAYVKGGEFELFAVTEANETHMRGATYMSTRFGTWPTLAFGEGEEHVGECSVFVDTSTNCAAYQNILSALELCLLNGGT